jgi:cysteine desulfuration protein SufE
MTSPTSIDAELDALVEEFELLGDWEQRYRYLIELGRGLPAMSADEHSDANKVRGCASQVWLINEGFPGGALSYRGDSDAHIVRGLIAVLLRLYNGHTAEEILAFNAPAGFEKLGLTGALTQQRSNGLAAMVQRIRRDAERAL